MGNMNLVTGYRGAAHVTADDHGSLYAGIFGEGNYVLDRGKKLAATAVSGNKINIADGDLILQGRHGRIAPGSTVSVTIDNGSQSFNRHDLIVARYTRNASTSLEDMNIVAIKGTATTGMPSDPAYTAGDILNEQAETADFPLYRVVLNGINIETVEPLFTVLSFVPIGADGKVAADFLPSMNYIPTSQKGAANGVASLGSDGKVPSGQLPSMGKNASIKIASAVAADYCETKEAGVFLFGGYAFVYFHLSFNCDAADASQTQIKLTFYDDIWVDSKILSGVGSEKVGSISGDVVVRGDSRHNNYDGTTVYTLSCYFDTNSSNHNVVYHTFFKI